MVYLRFKRRSFLPSSSEVGHQLSFLAQGILTIVQKLQKINLIAFMIGNIASESHITHIFSRADVRPIVLSLFYSTHVEAHIDDRFGRI